MTATRRAPARKPAPKPLAKPVVIAKPTPVEAADAAAGRRVREFLYWVAFLLAWTVSGLVTLIAARLYPDIGLWGAVAVDAVVGLAFVLFVVWRPRR